MTCEGADGESGCFELPLFPLHSVLFPGRPLPLHVFEPRYQRLLDDALTDDRRFGVVAIRRGSEVTDAPVTFDIGTVAEIEEVERYDDGRADITVRGVGRFRVVERLEDRPYPRALALPCSEPEANGDSTGTAEDLRRVLGPYLADLGAPQEMLARLPHEPAELGWLAAATLQVDLVEQQRLLELDGVGDRLAAAARLLRRESGIMRRLGATASLSPPGPGGPELN